jgi:hypothetical protein
LTFESDASLFSLDDRLVGTPGYRWWFLRLRLLIEEFSIERVRSTVACVEWFPYHSSTFRKLPILLPSQLYSFGLVTDAIAREAVIVVMRSRGFWTDSVPSLASADYLELKVPRSPYMTPANLTPEGFERVRTAVASSSS